MKTEQVPYTYLIGWSEHHKFYYGVRYSKKCHPGDLWKLYFTSSNRVKQFRKDYGEPDIIIVRRTFESVTEARSWEIKVLQRMKVVIREDFLNEHDAPSPPIRYGRRPPEVGKKISKKLKGKKKSKEHNTKIGVSVTKYYKDKPGPFKGHSHNEETKQIIKEKRALQKTTEETKQKMRDARSKQIMSPRSIETKEKLSNANIGLKMFNNGKINKKYFPGTEPDGFILGSLKKETNDE